jgi:hypothetical protein
MNLIKIHKNNLISNIYPLCIYQRNYFNKLSNIYVKIKRNVAYIIIYIIVV